MRKYIQDIICTNLVRRTTMKEKLEGDDLAILEELLLRQFIQQTTTGGSIMYKHKHCKIHHGPKGRKYIVMNKKKVYISASKSSKSSS
jgi:hypothetical protein